MSAGYREPVPLVGRRLAASREISSAPFFALGHGPEMPADGRTTITNASRRACTRSGAAPFLRATVAAVVGHRTRGRSKINGRRGYVRTLLAAATASEDRRGRGRIHGACTLLAVHPPKPPTAKPPAHARRGGLAPKSCATRSSRLAPLS